MFELTIYQNMLISTYIKKSSSFRLYVASKNPIGWSSRGTDCQGILSLCLCFIYYYYYYYYCSKGH